MTTIDFDLRACSEYYDKERKLWWESMRPWFVDQGYTLYNTVYYGDDDELIRDEPCSTFSGDIEFPYAFIGGCPEEKCTLYCLMHPRIVHAQDALMRHVSIKVVVTESDEYRILRLLRQLQPGSIYIQSFQCVTPIIDMLPFGDHHFVIMPRWGTDGQVPWFATIEEVIDCIRNSLIGLAFLHKNRIFHRDITYGNMLWNHFTCDGCFDVNELRSKLRAQKQLICALNDFDMAVLFPPDTDLACCRLPIIEARPGLDDKPIEVLHGEIDFNPFAYDVASLGIEFYDRYKYLCPPLPLLAPLLSGMVTHDLARRFTAEEALAFLNEQVTYLSPDDLKQVPEEPTTSCRWYEFDIWSAVPVHLARKWDRYRPKPQSFLVTSILRPICERRWGVYLVHHIRLLFSPLSLLRYG